MTKSNEETLQKLHEVSTNAIYEAVETSATLAADEKDLTIEEARESELIGDIAIRAMELMKEEETKLKRAIQLMEKDPEVIFLYLEEPYGTVVYSLVHMLRQSSVTRGKVGDLHI